MENNHIPSILDVPEHDISSVLDGFDGIIDEPAGPVHLMVAQSRSFKSKYWRRQISYVSRVSMTRLYALSQT